MDASERWLDTADLILLGQMLFPGDEHQNQEKRFDWSRDKVRITAQLIKTDNGYHLWSET